MDARELDYDLPEALIAQHPPEERTDARLLRMGAPGQPSAHHSIAELPALLAPSLLVFNDTRVLPVRLMGRKATGGRVEFLLLEELPATEGHGAAGMPRWRALARPAKSLKPGVAIEIGDGLSVVPVGRTEDGHVEVELNADRPVLEALAIHGRMPLPPYITRAADDADLERYQTVYARHPGAVAAPTAGLHFTPQLLEALTDAGHRIAFVTLHVGPGTFTPLRAERLSDHPMHAERYDVPEATVDAIAAARAEGRRVLAVGTTVVRTLEAAAGSDGVVVAGGGRTDIFIYPPYRFRVIDTLLTNFHLPRSTLLALVMAFGGQAEVRAAYAAAVEARYRFFSYGDAMLLDAAEVTP